MNPEIQPTAKVTGTDNTHQISATAPQIGKYLRYTERYPFKLPDRTWPDKEIIAAPRWCAVDLRDGNQALPIPMKTPEKANFFDFLVKMGFREIEIGYPAASKPEREFTRYLIEERKIPSHVTAQVLSMDRADVIKSTFERIKGIDKVIFHIYHPTSIDQRELFFKMTPRQIVDKAVEATKLVRKLSAKYGFQVQLQFSPESFTGTEMSFALDVCNQVVKAWDPGRGEFVIINLPSTVELSRPNIYADQVEWMNRSLHKREQIILSVHPHNDRGTAIAAAEMALQAGAERLEGTLFGNGERTGNLDLVVMALNLYKEGIDPRIDISKMPETVEIYERCTRMKVPPRHPAAGELAYVAYSGGHQAAISAGIDYQKKATQPLWRVPYVGIDPEDLGLRLSLIKINSQSGKYAAPFVLKQVYGVELTRDLRDQFGPFVKNWTDTNEDMDPSIVWPVFKEHLKSLKGELELCEFTTKDEGCNSTRVYMDLVVNGNRRVTISGSGNGPIDAACNALREIGKDITVKNFTEQSVSQGSDAEAVAILSIESEGIQADGAGVDRNIQRASFYALIAAVNRASAKRNSEV